MKKVLLTVATLLAVSTGAVAAETAYISEKCVRHPFSCHR